MAYPYGMQGAPAIGTGAPGLPRKPEIRGGIYFDQPGTYLVQVPEGCTTMCAAVRSASGGAFYANVSATYYVSSGGAAALAFKNDIPVTPLDWIMVVIGAAGMAGSGSPAAAGGDSWVVAQNVCRATGGQGGAQGVTAAGGTVAAGDGGGNGGNGAQISGTGTSQHASGGGAGGYAGNGGNGVANTSPTAAGGNPGTGGAGGSGSPGAPSGGVGMFGQGPSGQGGTSGSALGTAAGAGKGGSGGRDGQVNVTRSAGSALDGAGGSVSFQSVPDVSNGCDGAVYIVFGPGRFFPSTDVGRV